MKQVLLVSMPYGALDRPALGLSLLKPRLTARGFPCDIRYLTFTFAEFIGGEEYSWLATELPHTAFAGEWTFAEALYGPTPLRDQDYIKSVLQEIWHLDRESIERILHVRSLTEPFLDHCMATIPWRDYSLVGFTSTFEQNIASLALAQRIKAAVPRTEIVFGGSNWEGEMGVELHRQFPFVDLVCNGEADESFPALVEHLQRREAGRHGPITIPGVTYRRNGETVHTGDPDLMRNMDDLPIPDYSNYFDTLEQSSAAATVVPNVLVETSRGCWWGAKSHCTFCGLNGSTMAFRAKSPARVIQEFEYLSERWQTDLVQSVDNILSMQYFETVLPSLAQSSRKMQIFYEVKANLNREHIRLLRAAGVIRIQPGIESLNDHVLRLMRKGTTALQNIQMLKWCREYGVCADWNLLYGFPGETREDYEKTLELLHAIRFFSPPSACGPIRLDRFSPYYSAPADFGLINIRPTAPYRHLYPSANGALSRIACYFDFDYRPEVDPADFAQDVIAFIDDWQANPENGELRAIEQPDNSLCLVDTRSGASGKQIKLSGANGEAYRFCDSVRSCASVTRHLNQALSHCRLEEPQVRGFLQALVSNRLMVCDGDRYLSLAVGAPFPKPDCKPEARETDSEKRTLNVSV